MTSRDFCFWLQGYLEISKAPALDAEQTECVKRHLNLVFKHEIDPSMGGKPHQEVLDATHEGHLPGGLPPVPGATRPDGTVLRC